MGLWEVKNCTAFRARYICRQSLGTPVTPELPGPDPTPTLTGSCPRDWTSDPKLRHCYKVFSSEQLQDKKSWVQAQGACKELGAQLLSLASYEEEHFVANMLNKIFGESEPEIHEQHWFWIGLNRRDPGAGQNWHWSDGLGFSYHNFDRSRHDDDDIRGCAVLDLASLQWVAMQCDTQLDWICKIPRGTDVQEPDDGSSQGQMEWVRFQEAEYKFFEHHSTWVQAQLICTWFQSHLASVHSQAELDFLAHNLQKFPRGQEQHWWIGLYTSETDGRFRWADNSIINFISWAPGKPRPLGKDRKCVYLTASREDWGDQRCLTALPYICKRSNSSRETPSPDPPSTAQGGCPAGWEKFLNKCLRIQGQDPQDRVKWSEAQFSCEQQEAQLVTINNHIEQAFITARLPNVTFDLWIGLHASQRDFQWVGKEPLLYANWAPGEPSGPSPAPSGNIPTSCAVVLHSPSAHLTGRWDARSCMEEKHGFICQKDTDPSLSSAPETETPAPGVELFYLNGTFRLLQKPLRWQDALLLCESRNSSLAHVPDPYTQAFLTQAARDLRTPLWIGLSSEEGSRRYSWVSEAPLSYVSWQNMEPQHPGGCAYMDVDGSWRTTSCDIKLQGAVCGGNSGPPPTRRTNYHGSCPQDLVDSAWIPFREHCYSFHLEMLLGHKEALQRCQKVGGAVLSILDEMENVFVWEHLQSSASPSRGAWLGMNFNPKGGTLVWQDNTAVNYSNWGPPGLGPSMLSHNSCYWIQSSSGLWRPGACSNVTMGVVCKLPRALESNFSPSAALPENPAALAVVLISVLLLLALLSAALVLYRRRRGADPGTFEGARYSRSSSGPGEATEKNILVSDMEMNEQQE